jgi:uncharacterized protein YjbI with pentapeptide repeats
MANDEHVEMLKKGVAAWNHWRWNYPHAPWLPQANLMQADLRRMDFHEANLTGANLSGANLSGANFIRADLSGANLIGANLRGAKLGRANLIKANLVGVTLIEADLSGANLHEANLIEANLLLAKLRGADLRQADFRRANLNEADLRGVNLRGGELSGAALSGTDLSGADLKEAYLQKTTLVDTNLTDADLTGCRIFGISAWRLKLHGAKQQNLIITPADEPTVTVDNIEVAQFIYLLLHNEKIRDVIDTIGKKGVLLLGRFTEGRIVVLERLREKLRALGYVPIVFNFDKPETKDFTETVRLLANLSHFVIVDITNPRSAPLELQATVSDYMIPFAPILQDGEKPFAMFVDLQNRHDWVLDTIAYSSVDRLLEVLEDKIVKRAEAKFNELLARRTNALRVENV